MVLLCSCFYHYPIALQQLPWLCPPTPLTITSTPALSSLPHYHEVFKAKFHSHVHHTAQPKVRSPTHPLLPYAIPQPNLLLLPSGNIQSYVCSYSSYTLIYCNTTYISCLIVGKLGTLQGNVPAEDGDGQTRPTVYTSSFYHRTWLKTSCSPLLCSANISWQIVQICMLDVYAYWTYLSLNPLEKPCPCFRRKPCLSGVCMLPPSMKAWSWG